MNRHSTPTKPFTQMNAEELVEATKDLRARSIWTPMTDAERAEWDRHVAEHGSGRPRISTVAVRIPISLEGGLAERLDEYVRRTGMKRSQVIARELERLLSTDTPVVVPKRRPAAG